MLACWLQVCWKRWFWVYPSVNTCVTPAQAFATRLFSLSRGRRWSHSYTMSTSHFLPLPAAMMFVHMLFSDKGDYDTMILLYNTRCFPCDAKIKYLWLVQLICKTLSRHFCFCIKSHSCAGSPAQVKKDDCNKNPVIPLNSNRHTEHCNRTDASLSRGGLCGSNYVWATLPVMKYWFLFFL